MSDKPKLTIEDVRVVAEMAARFKAMSTEHDGDCAKRALHQWDTMRRHLVKEGRITDAAFEGKPEPPDPVAPKGFAPYHAVTGALRKEVAHAKEVEGLAKMARVASAEGGTCPQPEEVAALLNFILGEG